MSISKVNIIHSGSEVYTPLPPVEQRTADQPTWEPLNEEAYQKDVDLLREHFPEASFSLLRTREENHREHPIVEIEGQRYYFYSRAHKGPIVDENYIAQYQSSQIRESRPNFKVVRREDRIVFLMEFMGEEAPNFANEWHLTILIDLIARHSLNKKGLDMLPCRLALQDRMLYCVDPKPSYCTFDTEIEAFQENVLMLKDKISWWKFAEEERLMVFVDRIAVSHEIAIFEKMLETVPYCYQIQQTILPSSLIETQKIHLAAAVLRKFGTKDLYYIARDYCLSVEDQKEAKRLAGEQLVENTVIWDHEILSRFEELHKKAQKFLKGEGEFATFTNRVGNYKDVLTVVIENETYVVSCVDKEYVERFECQKEREHRPDFRAIPLEDGKVLFLVKFMGTQVVDYSNPQHLDLVVDLAMHFSDGEETTIDFNLGNLLVHEGELFYIDKDLTYPTTDNNRLTNLQGVFHSIRENLHVKEERIQSEQYVRGRFVTLLDPHDPKDIEIFKACFPDPFETFLAAIDVNKSADRITLFNNIPVYFHAGDDSEIIKNRTIAILEKILGSPFETMYDYCQILQKRIALELSRLEL